MISRFGSGSGSDRARDGEGERAHGLDRGHEEHDAALRGWAIRDLADAAGTTVRTIHYYVAEGVLPPPEGQRRSAIYPYAHLARLRLVALLRDEGLSLAAIRARVSSLDDVQAQSIAAEMERLLAQDAEGISALALFEAALTDLSAPTADATTGAAASSADHVRVSPQALYGRPTRDGVARGRVLREADDADAGDGDEGGARGAAGHAPQTGEREDAPELDSASAYVERLLAARRRAIRPQHPIVPHAPSPPAAGPVRPRPVPYPRPQPVPAPAPPSSDVEADVAADHQSGVQQRPSLVETWHSVLLEDGIELRVRADRVQAVTTTPAQPQGQGQAQATVAAQVQQALDALRVAMTGNPPTADHRPARPDRD